jgi:ABC-type antimicrobial peptide transport system permease subunit
LLRAIDPSLAVADVRTMERRVAASVAQPRFAATLLGMLAVVALVLAATGIYGVLAYGVAQRQREIGVRSVLGATPQRIVGLVVAQGLGLTALGLVLGTAGALAAAPLLANLLCGVEPVDPLTVASVAGIVTVVAALASWMPARRAARVDPSETLRAG